MSRTIISCLRVEHLAAAQMIDRAPLGGRHQPRARVFRNAGLRPVFERGQQGILRQILGQRHVAQHPRQAGDQPGLLDPPDGEDRAMGVGGRHGRRLALLTWRRPSSQLPVNPANARTSQVPSQPGIRSMWSCMNSRAKARASVLVPEFEDRVAADHLLGLDERAVDDAELPVLDPHPAPMASGISPPLSIMRPALISRSASLCIASRVRASEARNGGLDDEHEAHAKLR